VGRDFFTYTPTCTQIQTGNVFFGNPKDLQSLELFSGASKLTAALSVGLKHCLNSFLVSMVNIKMNWCEESGA